MISKMLHINEVDVTPHPVMYTCYGLGSCIGLFISDRQYKLSGGAHIPLPKSMGDGSLHDAPMMISRLLQSFINLGSDLSCLRAKITGGARVFETSQDIGTQNADAVFQQLVSNRIFVAACDVGGSISRTARFNSITGELQVSTLHKIYSI